MKTSLINVFQIPSFSMSPHCENENLKAYFFNEYFFIKNFPGKQEKPGKVKN